MVGGTIDLDQIVMPEILDPRPRRAVAFPSSRSWIAPEKRGLSLVNGHHVTRCSRTGRRPTQRQTGWYRLRDHWAASNQAISASTATVGATLRSKKASFFRHSCLAQAGEIGGFEQGADLRDPPVSG
jgi:hypothetical protein